MILLQMFFVFKGSWWKFFGALEAWIRRALPICGLLRFLETFELDSNDLWDLGRWFGWYLFECSLYSKLKFLKALRVDSCRAFLLLNLGLFLALLQPFRISLKCLRKAPIYRSFGGGWATRGGVRFVTHVTTWLVCLCHRLHALDCLLTRARLLVSSLTRAEVWLALAWHLANFCWFLSSDSKS